MVKISKRMQAICEMIPPCDTICDVGCDHAHLPIYLLQTKKIRHAIATDINEQPLKRAKEHVERYGLSDRIELRLGDGLQQLREGEAGAIVMAGMGGNLILHILAQSMPVAQKSLLLLQPQSDIKRVRQFLQENRLHVLAEDMIWEDGKFYPIMKAQYQPKDVLKYLPEELSYGRLLIKDKNIILIKFLEKEERITREILRNIERNHADGKMTERTKETYKKEKEKLAQIQHVLDLCRQ